MKASLAKGMPHGYEVGYRSFTINGRMLGHGEPVRVKQGERVLFHILNGSATEIRSLALPGHTFQGGRVRRQSRAASRRRAGALAGNGGANLGHRGNEPSGRVDHGRPRRRRSRPRHGHRGGIRGPQRKAQWGRHRAIPLELRALCEARCTALPSRTKPSI